MTTDTEDDGFTTVHQSAAFAGAGAGGVVRPDLPLTLSAAQAEIKQLRAIVQAYRDGDLPDLTAVHMAAVERRKDTMQAEIVALRGRVAELEAALEDIYEMTVAPSETDHKSVRGWIEVHSRNALFRRALTNGGDHG